MSKKIISQLFMLVGLLVFAAFAIPNATNINDWLHSLGYSPDPVIQKIADDAGMSDTGKRFFYRYEPTLLSEQEIEQQCGFGELVLGCFTNDGIFIVDFKTEQEYNRTLVTAAHEMLHVAYLRQGNEVNNNLRDELDSAVAFAEQDVKREINSYKDMEQRYDEAFAIVGSQINDVPRSLEQKYEDYFTNRSKVTNAFSSSPEAD